MPQGESGLQNGRSALCRRCSPQQPGRPLHWHGWNPFPSDQEGSLLSFLFVARLVLYRLALRRSLISCFYDRAVQRAVVPLPGQWMMMMMMMMTKIWKIRSCTLKLYSVLLRHLGRPGPETHKLKVNSINLVADVFTHISSSSYLFSSIWTENKDSSLCCACLHAASFQTDLCTLMCGKLKLSTWKVQLAVLQAMKAYFQGWGPQKHKLYTLDLGSLPQFELFS